MATITAISQASKRARSYRISVAWNVSRYIMGKLITLFIGVVISVLLIILIANYGGYVDKMVRGEIDFVVGAMFQGQLPGVPFDQRMEIINQTRYSMYEAAGLNEPFIKRTLRWLWLGITLDFGSPLEGSPFFPTVNTEVTIRQVLLQRLPPTLSLFGSANLLIFFTSVTAGIFISRRYEKPIDRILKMLAPLSAIPAWFYGALFGIVLPILGWQLPKWFLLTTALFLGAFFQATYMWRSFFLIYSEEDYVEIAKAKGLTESVIQRRYMIRPAMPTILTHFALMLVGLWMGSIVLETIFDWPGIGQLLFSVINFNDTGMIVSIIVVYAYMLALTIFLLDIAYALVDPRVRVGSNEATATAAIRRNGIRNLLRYKPRDSYSDPVFRVNKRGLLNLTAWLGNAGKNLLGTLREAIRKGLHVFDELKRYPPARRSLMFIAFLLAVGTYTVIAVPYETAIDLWRGDGNIFIRYPLEAQPEWLNFFRKEKLPPNIIFDTHKGEGQKTVEKIDENTKLVTISFQFDYPYSAAPQDMTLYIDSHIDKKQGLFFLYWQSPSAEPTMLANFIGPATFPYSISLSKEVQRKIKSANPEKALFTDADNLVRQGAYTLTVETFLFEPDADVDIEFVARGQVYGLAGTDYKRRDIMVELLWGLPIVLAFGLLGAVITNLLSMLIAAVGAWYGGWVDGLLQRITELNMAIPAFPISLMIFVMYSKSIWVILIVTILLSIFGSGIKTFRATFLQVRESQYIEAAQAYGASNLRIVFQYMLPRIISVLVPQIIVAIPSFVFLEASLAFLGLSDPVFPTWGKMLVDTIFVRRGTALAYDPVNMLFYTHFYTGVLIPAILLILLAVSFNKLGSYMEKALNPRLKSE